MCKYCILIFFIFLAIFSFGQTPTVNQLKTTLEEVGSSINKGYTSKSWKKEGEAWIESIGKIDDVSIFAEQVEKLIGYLGSKAFTNKPTSSASANSIKEATERFLSVLKLIKAEAVSIDLTSSIASLEKGLASIIAKEEAELKAKEALKKMEPFISDFKNEFAKLFEDSKKGEFAASRSGSIQKKGNEAYYQTSLKFGESQVVIEIGEEENHRAVAQFNCSSDKKMALQFCKLLEPFLTQEVPETYKMSRDYSSEYSGSVYAYVWEHESEKFIEIAKRPTVSVGVLKSNGEYTVFVKIIEPVFKR
ncbi:MAG: hypothetical protein JKY54_10580 [Flavobacteriales bacterium]|nr:hypothetical protein [Flavobacteriales bacterium]